MVQEEYPTISPAKFYGSSLPRPYLYTDVKFNAERVDPPVPVGDPFLLWAHDAHWKMGGLNLERRRMQGKIEGSVQKLRKQKEKDERRRNRQRKRMENAALDSDDSEDSEEGEDKEPEEVKKVEEEKEEEEEVMVAKRAVGCRRSKRLRKLAQYSEEE